MPWRLGKLDEGDALPSSGEFAGLAMMGGPMSVNDDLPWIEPMLTLVRTSVSSGVPVIGHCLGGQLLSRALGGRVTRNPVKEIGWGEVQVVDPAAAWGPAQPFLSYHWHGETFSIPEGATRIWSSAHCDNQAFVIGTSIGMQCHIEMTGPMIESWCETGAREIEHALARSPAVQTPDEMRVDVATRLGALHQVAGSVYDRWLQGVPTDGM